MSFAWKHNVIVSGDYPTPDIRPEAEDIATIWQGDPQSYEDAVVDQLKIIQRRTTGRDLFDELERTPFILLISPYLKADLNANTWSTCWLNSVVKGVVTDSGVATGVGSSTFITYDPSRFDSGMGPGATPDSVLLHEVVHAYRRMLGVLQDWPAGTPQYVRRDFPDIEEFTAVLIANIYDAEAGRTQLRDLYSLGGFKPLEGIRENQQNYYRWARPVIDHLCAEMPDLTAALAKVQCWFNPFRVAEHHPSGPNTRPPAARPAVHKRTSGLTAPGLPPLSRP
jgi:hypothetical protein